MAAKPHGLSVRQQQMTPLSQASTAPSTPSLCPLSECAWERGLKLRRAVSDASTAAHEEEQGLKLQRAVSDASTAAHDEAGDQLLCLSRCVSEDNSLGSSSPQTAPAALSHCRAREFPPGLATLEEALEEVREMVNERFGRDQSPSENCDCDQAAPTPHEDEDGASWTIVEGRGATAAALEDSLEHVKALYTKKFGLDADAEERDCDADVYMDAEGTSWTLCRGTGPVSGLEERQKDVKPLYKRRFAVGADDAEEGAEGEAKWILLEDDAMQPFAEGAAPLGRAAPTPPGEAEVSKRESDPKPESDLEPEGSPEVAPERAAPAPPDEAEDPREPQPDLEAGEALPEVHSTSLGSSPSAPEEVAPEVKAPGPESELEPLAPSESCSASSDRGSDSSSEGREELLDSFDLAGVARYIEEYGVTRIVVCCGAGISTSAGIPDFRSPGTGLYDNLQQFCLPTAECMFDLAYFKEHPEPFYELCKDIWPGRSYEPTICHHLLRLLADKGMLQRVYTQNIDSLEHEAGLSPELVVAAHGNFDGCHVVGDESQDVPVEELKAALDGRDGGWKGLAERRGGLVKPNITFFGEEMPRRFFELREEDMRECELLIVMGTSLVVEPFNELVGMAPRDVPRLLVNREQAGLCERLKGGFCFHRPNNYRDVFYRGDCDSGARQLARRLGWAAELRSLTEARRRAESSQDAEEGR